MACNHQRAVERAEAWCAQCGAYRKAELGHWTPWSLPEVVLLAAKVMERQQPDGTHFVPTCKYCESQEGTPDGEKFVHGSECEWEALEKLLT